ncbi:MAG: NUDIX hydrolase [Cyclobacteriaceae bacterium]|nr:NUDIX hydrolase [Cyclobacteriaceae bacterium]MCH8517315.1 NUDIX hydrolase [Cyclobacteriaceae bacterium]
MSTSNPFTKLSERIIYENDWIGVFEDEIIKPNGEPGQYGKVHFKNTAIGIVPLDAEGYTFLVGQYRYTLNEYSWEIPMGGVPEEEDHLAGAQRELEEETGLKARKWQKIMRIHTSNSVTDEVGYVFLAEDLHKGATNFDDTEVIHLKRLPLRDAWQMVMDGLITDAISIAGISKACALKGILS